MNDLLAYTLLHNFDFLVRDETNNGILRSTKNPIIANYLARGFLASEIWPQKLTPEQVKFVNDNSIHYIFEKGKLTSMNPKFITQEYIERKKQAELRFELFEILLRNITLYLQPDLDFIVDMENEFNYILAYSSDSQHMKELAKISNIDQEALFRLLTLRHEEIRHKKLYFYALTQKYIDIINKVKTKTDQDHTFSLLEKELLRHASI